MEAEIIKYWDGQWEKRSVHPGVFMCNVEKANRLLHELWWRPQYVSMRKLDVGCGTTFHAARLSQLCPEWGRTYYGIDISSKAVEIAKTLLLNVEQQDFYTWKTSKRFELFMFMDTLEHLEDHGLVARKILELATPSFNVFGNIPLYQSAHGVEGGFERPMDINALISFLGKLGVKPDDFQREIYGCFDYPYMWFAAKGAL